MATKTAQQLEATGAIAVFDYDGQSYCMDPDLEIEVLELMEDGALIKAAKTMLGEAEYAKFRAKHTKLSELKKFLKTAMATVSSKN